MGEVVSFVQLTVYVTNLGKMNLIDLLLKKHRQLWPVTQIYWRASVLCNLVTVTFV